LNLEKRDFKKEIPNAISVPEDSPPAIAITFQRKRLFLLIREQIYSSRTAEQILDCEKIDTWFY